LHGAAFALLKAASRLRSSPPSPTWSRTSYKSYHGQAVDYGRKKATQMTPSSTAQRVAVDNIANSALPGQNAPSGTSLTAAAPSTTLSRNPGTRVSTCSA